MIMTRINTLFSSRCVGAALLLLVASAAPTWANGDTAPCNVESIAGSWLFGTEVGQQSIFPEPGDITAIGTMNIDSMGNVSGEFDATVSEFTSLTNIVYTGTVTVNPDCRGTLTFVTGAGTSRTDTIGVLSRSEMWGMSRDIASLWTYRVRRISKAPGPDAVSDKLDALLRRLGVFLPKTD